MSRSASYDPDAEYLDASKQTLKKSVQRAVSREAVINADRFELKETSDARGITCAINNRDKTQIR